MKDRPKQAVLFFDLRTNGGLLLFLLAFPTFFLVPYVDDWMRIRAVDAHGVWWWTYTHARDWVVRPAADLLVATLASFVTHSGGHEATAKQFLTAFRAGYFLSITAFALLLYVQARALFRRSVAGPSLLACLWLIVLFASDQVGFAFFWVDGYANFIFPFMLLTIGMALTFRRGARTYAGALCLFAGALGHEVICLYAIGFSGLTLAARMGALDKAQRASLITLFTALISLLYVQVFSSGPQQRALAYAARTGKRFNLEGALSAVAHINLSMCVLSFAATLCALAIYHEALEETFTAARDDARKHPVYWRLMCLGTAIAVAIPYASIGLTKHKLLISLYGAATILFVVLTAVLSYPLLPPLVHRGCRLYRKSQGSVVPLVIVVALLTPNPALFRDAWVHLPGLRRQAERYVKTLKQSQVFASVCRPAHPFALGPRSETAREAAWYFGFVKVHEDRCPRP